MTAVYELFMYVIMLLALASSGAAPTLKVQDVTSLLNQTTAITQPASKDGRTQILKLAALVAEQGLLAARDEITVVPSKHAEKHPEAFDIRETLCEKGPSETYKMKWVGGDKFFFICQIKKGPFKDKWGFQIATKNGNTWYEITAYIKRDGVYKTLLRWLIDIGATKVKNFKW